LRCNRHGLLTDGNRLHFGKGARAIAAQNAHVVALAVRDSDIELAVPIEITGRCSGAARARGNGAAEFRECAVAVPEQDGHGARLRAFVDHDRVQPMIVVDVRHNDRRRV